MSDLTDALNKILYWLQQNRPSDVELLETGLSEAEIEEIIEDLPLQLPQDILELYKWKNGSTIIGEYENFCWAFEWWSFYSLEIVINGYRHRLKSSRNHYWAPEFPYKTHNSLGIFFSPELTDTGYAVIDETKHQVSPIIFLHSKAGADTPIIKYASLTTMMQTVAECYEQAYYMGADGYLVPDEVKKLEIWRKYNSEYIAEAALAKLNGELSLELLLDVETDLIQAQHPMAVEPLLQVLQIPIFQDDDLAIQLLAINVLGELGDTRAICPLINCLQNKNITIRHYAITSLGKLKNHQATIPLIELLQDSDYFIRRIAARALGEIKDTRALQSLRQLTHDEDSSVRQTATIALKKLAQSVE
jgi:HEAT repeats/SMI1 / KNR4 family (SUKH-1)